jgi:hypothetical protein
VKPFIIYSLPRSASTTALSIVNSAGAHACNEPFSNKNFKAPYLERSLKTPVQSVMKQVFEEWDGFKHCAHPTGYPFPPSRRDLNFSMLFYPGMRTVLLRRKNLLAQVVSSLIAEQCRLWNCYKQEESEERQSFQFSALNHDTISRRLDEARLFNDLCREAVRRSGNEYILIHTDDGPWAKSLTDFLGLPTHSESLSNQPDGERSESVYHLIPELEDVERTFGGADGHLTFPKPVIK